MKVINALLVGLLLSVCVAAQTPSTSQTSPGAHVPATVSDAPGATMSHFKWQREVYVPALNEDPMGPSRDHARLEREQKDTIRDNTYRVKEGREPVPLPSQPVKLRPDKGGTFSSVSYLYQTRIKNTGAKTIRVIVWEYVLLDPDSGVEVGKHQFTNSVRMRAGETSTLSARSGMPPTSIVVAPSSGKEAQTKYSEHVTITRIEYEDGTFWQRPLN